MADNKGKNGSKKNNGQKTMQDYRERQSRINRGAKIMALVLVGAMIVFYVISAGMFLWD